MDIIHLDSIDSTNLYIKNNYQSLNHLDLIYTFNQKNGRGRHLNQWFSDQDSLSFSILLKEDLLNKNLHLLPLLLAMTIHKTLSNYSNHFKIKWPNDITFNHKKISGILIESIFQDQLNAYIIGIGLNLNNKEFPSHLRDIATSLKLITEKTHSKEKFIKDIRDNFLNDYSLLESNPDTIIEYCNQYNALEKQLITYQDQNTIKEGICQGIDKQGRLLVENKKKIITLISGEVNKVRIQKSK